MMLSMPVVLFPAAYTVLTCTSSQSLELPQKSASVPGDATADSAESCPASNVATGDRKGEPRATAGEEALDLNNGSEIFSLRAQF